VERRERAARDPGSPARMRNGSCGPLAGIRIEKTRTVPGHCGENPERGIIPGCVQDHTTPARREVWMRAAINPLRTDEPVRRGNVPVRP